MFRNINIFGFIYFIGDYMKFIAHRGLDKHNFKENSIEAFKYCFNSSYIDGVEMDVRLTRDKKVVISHDDYDGIYNLNFKFLYY